MFWHSDKPTYQRDTAVKITQIMKGLGDSRDRQKQWFQAFLYIFNKHWNIVDNFRIDKYLMFLRLQFSALFDFLKDGGYSEDDLAWISGLLSGLMGDNTTALGIPLQICDVYLPELCKTDGQDIAFETLARLLHPFLHTAATSGCKILTERIREKVFNTLLESNVTLPSESDISSEEEDLSKVDGGKLSKKTRKELLKMINTKYVFPNFNILLYAENYIFPVASAVAEEKGSRITEDNRESMYDLYYKALKLEPESKPELTFTERQLVARARQFITMRMRKRLELRKVKQQKKASLKLQKMITQKMMADY